MKLNVSRPELQKFITEQVKAGSFRSGDEVAEEAIARMMQESTLTLTEEDRRAIDDSEEQIDRGEYVEFDVLAAQMRKKYTSK